MRSKVIDLLKEMNNELEQSKLVKLDVWQIGVLIHGFYVLAVAVLISFYIQSLVDCVITLVVLAAALMVLYIGFNYEDLYSF